jgi:hypothetical protein
VTKSVHKWSYFAANSQVHLTATAITGEIKYVAFKT